MSDLLGHEPALAGDAPRGLGRALVGAPGKVKRQPNDFYPTPRDVTRALLRVEGNCLAAMAQGPVWEPCGRGGAVLAVLREAGFAAVGSDIVADPAHGVIAQDLLRCKRAMGNAVVTNPPFAIAGEIIALLLERLRMDYLALLLKATFWHAEERRVLFRLHPPARIWALTWRPDFMGLGAPMMECAWVVWQKGWALGTRYDLLPREAEAQKALALEGGA